MALDLRERLFLCFLPASPRRLIIQGRRDFIYHHFTTRLRPGDIFTLRWPQNALVRGLRAHLRVTAVDTTTIRDIVTNAATYTNGNCTPAELYCEAKTGGSYHPDTPLTLIRFEMLRIEPTESLPTWVPALPPVRTAP